MSRRARPLASTALSLICSSSTVNSPMIPSEDLDASLKRGVLRWTLTEVQGRLREFAVGTLLLSVVFIVVSAVLTAPQNAEPIDRLVRSLLAFLLAIGVVLPLTFAYSGLLPGERQLASAC